MAELDAILSLKELLVSTLAMVDAATKLLIEKGVDQPRRLHGETLHRTCCIAEAL